MGKQIRKSHDKAFKLMAEVLSRSGKAAGTLAKDLDISVDMLSR